MDVPFRNKDRTVPSLRTYTDAATGYPSRSITGIIERGHQAAGACRIVLDRFPRSQS